MPRTDASDASSELSKLLPRLVDEGFSAEIFEKIFRRKWPRDFAPMSAAAPVAPEKNSGFAGAHLLGAVKNFPHSAERPNVRLTLPIVHVELQSDKVLTARSSRRRQFAYAKKILAAYSSSGVPAAPGIVCAGLFIFSDASERTFRLSLVSASYDGGGNAPRWNSARRQSFFVSAGTPNRTFVSRLSAPADSLAKLREIFSVEALTKEFYRELFYWYEYACDTEKSGIRFPGKSAETLDAKLIRLITRLIFVRFLREKELVPAALFDETALRKILKNFDPLSATDGCYYNAILQNLFFATLNREIKESDGSTRCFAKNKGKTDLKTLYRYAEMFRCSEAEAVSLFAEIPFLNGGLFECLDKTQGLNGVPAEYADGFSRNPKCRARIPNKLFFDPERGLLPILTRYNFTVEENTPLDEQVALDPELLGKVFENLLGTYNPETRQTARNESGSFYTPREIVNYMVGEALIAYLAKRVPAEIVPAETLRSLVENAENGNCDDACAGTLSETAVKSIADALLNVRVLDPACGSGAFPMGMLTQMIALLEKIGRLNADKPQAVYEAKLRIIEKCIFGGDIQPIAVQISKLRFFISLICDRERGGNADSNFNMPALPNLESNFVAANSLLSLKPSRERSLFDDPKIDETKDELREVRHKHFRAKTAHEKRQLRERDEELRAELSALLVKNDTFAPADAKTLAAWNPYDQNACADFFDPAWMFGFSENDAFDIVIGNPPYVVVKRDDPLNDFYGKNYACAHGGKKNLYRLFFERSINLLKNGGALSFITPNTFLSGTASAALRKFFFGNVSILQLLEYTEKDRIFENVAQAVVVSLMTRGKAPKNHTVFLKTDRQGYVSAKQSELQDADCLVPVDSIVAKAKKLKTKLSDFLIGKQGEINVSTKKDAYSRERTPDSLPMWRGDMVGRYVRVSEPTEFCKISATNRTDFKFERILTQQVSNQSQRNRTKCCLIPSNSLCAHSTNYLLQPKIGHGGLCYWLGVLNSRIFAYIFDYANPTNNIPIGKLIEIPVPAGTAKEQKPIVALVEKILAAKRGNGNADTSAWEREIDKLVYALYGLTEEEIAHVEAACGVPAKSGVPAAGTGTAEKISEPKVPPKARSRRKPASDYDPRIDD